MHACVYFSRLGFGVHARTYLAHREIRTAQYQPRWTDVVPTWLVVFARFALCACVGVFAFRFQGATAFINNDVTEDFDTGGRGAALFSWSSEPMVFSGPVTVSGNTGMVSQDISPEKGGVMLNVCVLVVLCRCACSLTTSQRTNHGDVSILYILFRAAVLTEHPPSVIVVAGDR